MRSFRITVVLLLGLFIKCQAQISAGEPLANFYGERQPGGGPSGTQPSAAAWEDRFRSMPDTAQLREHLRILSAHPHHVGSAFDRQNAEWILARFREWGLDARIESFDVLFPTPKERLVELIEPSHFTASLREPPVPGDSTSGQQDEQLATYNAYSVDGDVTGRLVYVNFGIPDDYEQLDRMGISVRGAIVLARYGASWRGIKPKVAAEHGAIGCLIYSDPGGDGYYQGDVYPSGAWRPPDGVQRGSVLDMPIYPGDPQTPGVGATGDAKRLPLDQVKVFTSIPVLPISYADAAPLIACLGGPVAPEKWRGALGITYHVGPGPARVHLVVRSNWETRKIFDVIATIRGSTEPDEWIIRGNHHDAWVNGAEDPLSGQVALLEEARGFGVLLKEGWKPRRTIMFCAWDGEEPGLLGSTEWVEAHSDALAQHAAVYINSDSNGRGYIGMGGSHTLESFINGVVKDIRDPEADVSVWKRAQMRRVLDADQESVRNEVRERHDLRIGALGSGSDYTAFLDHLGIASLNLGFGGEDGGGIYHSIYDDFFWYTHFSDTSFAYGRALAQTAGTAVMRLADDELLPFDFTDFAETIHTYVDDLQKTAAKLRDAIIEKNREIADGVFAITADPRKVFIPPGREQVPPRLNFSPLLDVADRLTQSAQRYHRAEEKYRGGSRSPVVDVNKVLLQSERKLTSAEGLPKRPWFRHQVYAPGLYTGYGVKTLPAVREAIEQKRWEDADREIARVAKVLDSEAALIDSASGLLEQVGQ